VHSDKALGALRMAGRSAQISEQTGPKMLRFGLRITALNALELGKIVKREVV
jgi:hypothetical protein